MTDSVPPLNASQSPGDEGPDRLRILWEKTTPYIQLFIPIVCGAGAFFYVLFQYDNLAIVPATAFHGMRLSYAMLFGSISTVLAGTIIYLREMREIKEIAHKSAGWRELISGYILLVITILIFGGIFLFQMMQKNEAPNSRACDFENLHHQALLHDFSLAAVFLLFVIIDWLTRRGMMKAKVKCETSSELADLAKQSGKKLKFASQQLWLVDVPVLVGIFLSILIAAFLPAFSGWDPALFDVERGVRTYFAQARSSTLFTCSLQPLTIEEFQTSIAQIFAAGIATGYLAAHILMSQMVFIILHFFQQRADAEDSDPKV